MPYRDDMRVPMTKSQRGFTLVEAVIVIAITGIVAAMVAVFIRAPIQAYFDSARRAQLTDTADTALRRISRDLRLALPNSVRVIFSGNVYYLEFLQTSGGGRYRAAVDGSGGTDQLDFNASDDSFDVLGPPVAMVPGAQNLVAIYNLGIDDADAYRGDNTSRIVAINGNVVQITARQFPFASPGNRFQIISSPVTYICDPGAGRLTRVWGYAVQAVQPTSFAVDAPRALLAQDVSDCGFTYDAQAINQRAGQVSIWLRLTQSNEQVSLYHEVHVSNAP